MGRPLRYLDTDVDTEAWSLVEVTTRTIQGRLLLRPSKDLNDIVLGVLGRALSKHSGVGIVAFTFLSNHYVMLLLVRDAGAMARFMGFVDGNLSLEVGRLHRWPGKLWGRRYRHIPVVDEQAEVDRMRYVLAHGVKEGLVARAEQWPGAKGLPALLHGEILRGTWFDRSAEYEARRRGKKVKKRDFATTYEVPLVALPCWRDLSVQQRRKRIAQMVASIEADGRKKNRARGRPPQGIRRSCRQNPHAILGKLDRTPAPLCHASTKAGRRAFGRAYNAFFDAFHKAADALRAADMPKTAEFPPGSFPPRLPFILPTTEAHALGR